MSKFLTVGDVCNITTGSLDSNAFVENGKYPFYTCAKEPTNIDTYAFDDDVVLVAGNNAQGNFHVNRFKGKFNAYQRTYILTSKGEKSIDYIYYLLSLALKLLKDKSQGSQTKFLTIGILKEIHVPNLANSQIVAKVLSDLDAKIELNNRINAELEAMAKTLYDYWFVQFEFPFDFAQGKPNVPGVVAERSRGYKSSGGKMVYNAELKREIPEGWEVKTISEWIKKDKNGDWGKETEEGNYQLKVSCVRGADLNGLNGNGELKPPTRFILVNNSNKLLENHDLIVEISGGSPTQSTGRLAFITEETLLRFQNPLICSNFCKALTLNEEKYLYNFVYQWNRLYDNGVLFGWEGKTSGIKNLLFESFVTKHKEVFPKSEIVEKFYDFVKPIQSQKQKNLLQNQQLSELRDWLLPMLMNGQVTIAEAEKAVYKEEEAMCVAAEPEIDYGKSNIELSKRDAFLRKLMLASHIVYELCEESTFGHTKLMKLLYLCEQVGGMALQTNYKKFAAGPFDGKTLTLIDLEYSKNKWFTLDKRSYTVGGKQREATIYIKTEKSLCYKKHFDNYFGQESESIDRLISLFRSEKTQTAEIVATLYFAWEELIAKKTIVSEPVLIKAFYDFHKEKKKFTNEQIMGGYHFMLKQGVHPELK